MKMQRLASVLLALAILHGALLGIAATGTIVGRVTDPSGAVVPGATVTILNIDTNAARMLETDESGAYSAPLLVPGKYRITVEKTTFSTAVFNDIILAVNDTLRVDAAIRIGQRSDEVTVGDEALPLVQADSSTIGQVIDRRKITELPLNERNFLSFALLTPGSQMPAEGSQNSGQGAATSVNGAREQSNNYLLDGSDNNDLAINHYTVLPSVDAIEEFRVQSSNSSAEFGRNGGAQINVVLKSGTNDLHGSAFWFLRNRNLDARNFFDRPECTASSIAGSCAEKPGLDRSQFGGTLGGPLRRDKTFLFGSYEGLRLRQAVTREATVPSLAQRNAVFAAVPSALQNPAGVAALNQIPTANAGSSLQTSNRFVGSPIERDNWDQFMVKLDHKISSSHQFAGHYSYFDQDRFNPYDPFFASTSLPGYGTSWLNRGQSVGLTFTSIFSPRLINDARVSFNRLSAGIFQEDPGAGVNATLSFPVVSTKPIDQGFPGIFIAGFDGIGAPVNAPQQRHDNTYQFADTLAWNPAIFGGKHRLKLGADVRRVQVNFFLDYLSRGVWQFVGAFTGNPIEDLVRGLPVAVATLQGTTDAGLRTTSYNFFFQDDVQLLPRFTLNFGLRYEFNGPAVEIRDRMSVPDTSPKSLTCTPQPECQFIQAGTSGIPRATYSPDRNNFAPRFGFSWRPLGTDRFVVRSGYGIYYDATIANISTGPRFNPPFAKTQVFPNNGTNNIQNILQQPGFAPPAGPLTISPDFKDPYMQQWNLDLQYGVATGMVLDVAYVGSKGTNLIARRNVNQPQPGSAPPLPQFGAWQDVESESSSSYHSLQVRSEKRWNHGFMWLSSYTYSKSIDSASAFIGTASEPGLPQDSTNLHSERGLSNFDARHRFVTSLLYDIPYGMRPGHQVFGNWQLGGIVTLQSGRPFTVNRAIDQSLTGNVFIAQTDRPDQISDPYHAGPVPQNPDPLCSKTVSAGGRAADIVRDPSSWFNPCAFAAANGRFGTAGRNSILGPGFNNFDISMTKTITYPNEGRRFEVRFEFFNVFNHPNFDNPDRSYDSPTFGRVRSANAYGGKPSRQIQLGLKYIF